MTDLLFGPHGDDAELFAAYLCCEHRPLVIVCVASGEEREAETAAAMVELGCEWRQWPDPAPHPPEMRLWMQADLEQYDPRRVFAPAVEEGGHEEHSLVGRLALEVFGERVTSYLTYTRSGGRSRWGSKLDPRPEWIAAKHRALACYLSQIRDPATRPWFTGQLDEYVAL